MFDFLASRGAERKAARAALIEQEEQRAAQRERIARMVALLKDLLRDPRYADYTQLLREERATLVQVREATLQTVADRARRDFEATLLTGRLLELDRILSTPNQFLALAEQGEASPPTPAARSPARQSGW